MYRTKSVFISYDEDGDCSITADECIEQDSDPIDTGLVDHRGDPIYSVREAVPFGFVKHG